MKLDRLDDLRLNQKKKEFEALTDLDFDEICDCRQISKKPHSSSNQKFRLAMLAVSGAIGLLAFTVPASAISLDSSRKFIAPDSAGPDLFGLRVALDGDYALIGSHLDDENGLDSGSAYLFDITSGEQLQKFIAPDGAIYDWFGLSVALDGDYALIGSHGDDDSGGSSGSAYLFDTTTGDFIEKFIAPDAATADYFGRHVALDGDYALIGSYGDDDNGSESGSAYLFDINSGDFLQKFIAPDAASGDRFGAGVALNEDYALIASPWDDNNDRIKGGSVYLFDITSGDQRKKFTAPDGASGHWFGISIALDGDYALIGSRWDYDNETEIGSAYLFDITSGDLLQKFIVPDAPIDDYFDGGNDEVSTFSVALDGDYALIGSGFDDHNGSLSGSAYLFDVTSGDLLETIVAPNGASHKWFGKSVALDGHSALIGSPADSHGKDSGSAYLFTIEKVPEPSAVLGLIAIGSLGVLHRFSGKQKR